MADSRWIYTPIGGGKTLYSVMEFYKELARTERFCVNNLPIIFENPPDDKYHTAQDYCHMWISKPVDLVRRVFVLDADQAREFWRYQPIGNLTEEHIAKYNLTAVKNVTPLGTFLGVKMPNKPHKLYGEICDFTLRQDPDSPHFQRGTFYQIDECHKNFPARYWQQLGPQVEDYVSELRKFNDDCDWITQHPEKVDKNLRRNATEWVQITNLMKTRLFMGVTLNKRFRFHGYQQVDMPTRADKPDYSGGFKIGEKDRIEYTYLTLQGQSVRGGAGTEEIRYKGRHPIIWVLAVIAIFAAAHYGPPAVEKAVQESVSHLTSATQRGVQAGIGNLVAPVPVPSPQPAREIIAPPISRPRQDPNVIRPRPNDGASIPPWGNSGRDSSLYVTGVATDSTNAVVILSDGEILTSADHEVLAVGKKYIRTSAYGVLEIKSPPANPPAANPFDSLRETPGVIFH